MLYKTYSIKTINQNLKLKNVLAFLIKNILTVNLTQTALLFHEQPFFCKSNHCRPEK